MLLFLVVFYKGSQVHSFILGKYAVARHKQGDFGFTFIFFSNR